MSFTSHNPAPRSRSRLRALGLRPRKRLSQSFLDDESVAAAIVRAAHLDRGRDEVLEVGPGLGVLTERLLRAARRVTAIEVDPALADWLRVEFGADGLIVHTADVLTTNPSTFFERPFVVVANLPYHITSPALRHLLESGPPFAERIVVTVQAEVAERITASAGQLSALAVGIQSQAEVRLIRRIPRTAFYPPPNVDSAVLRLDPLLDSQRLVPRTQHAEFVRLVQAGFKQPRKQLANSLAEGLGVAKGEAVDLLASAGIEPTRRPQGLELAEWVTLFQAAQVAR